MAASVLPFGFGVAAEDPEDTTQAVATPGQQGPLLRRRDGFGRQLGGEPLVELSRLRQQRLQQVRRQLPTPQDLLVEAREVAPRTRSSPGPADARPRPARRRSGAAWSRSRWSPMPSPAAASRTTAAAVVDSVRCLRAHRQRAGPRRVSPGRHRLVGQPVLDVLGQGPRRGVAVLGPQRHRLQADRLQRRGDPAADLARAAGTRPARPRCSSSRRRRARRTAAGRSAGSRASPPGCTRRWPAPALEPAGGLLRAHVRRRAQRRARCVVGSTPRARRGRSVRLRRSRPRPLQAPADGLGQAPVDHQRLAVGAEHDVARLQVAVQHAPAVGIGDRVADVEEPAAAAPQRQASARRGRVPAPPSAWKRPMASLRLSPWMNRMA